MKAVAHGFVAWRQPHDGRINNFIAEQHNQPMYRPNELSAVSAPAHALGNRQRRKRLLNQPGHQIHRWLTLLYGAVNQPGTFIGLQRVELIRSYAQRGGEAGKSTCWVAGVIKRGFHGRAAFFNGLVGLGIGQIAYAYSYTARRSKGFYLTECDASFFQTLGDTLSERIRQWLECFRGQFFNAQFDQKILLCHDYAFPSACGACFAFLPFLPLALLSAASAIANTSWRKASGASGKPSLRRLSKYAWATARARVRTRRMNRWRSVTEIAWRASNKLNVCDAFKTCS